MMDKPPEELPYEALAYHVLSAVRKLDDPTVEQLKNFDAVLQAVPPATRFIEVAALHFLAEMDSEFQGKLNATELAGARRLVLDVAALSEEAAAIEKIYGQLGLSVSPEYREVLLAEGKRARQHKSGHSYSLEKFGLDAGAIRSGLAELFEQYGWDREE